MSTVNASEYTSPARARGPTSPRGSTWVRSSARYRSASRSMRRSRGLVCAPAAPGVQRARQSQSEAGIVLAAGGPVAEPRNQGLHQLLEGLEVESLVARAVA